MSFYLSILAVQHPFQFDVDDNNRAMFSCNFELTARHPLAADMLAEVASILADNGLGTLYSALNTTGTVFLGSSAVIPPDLGNVGPFIHLIDTAGMAPHETHNGDKILHLSCQVIVRSSDPSTARARAVAIWQVLDGVRNTDVVA